MFEGSASNARYARNGLPSIVDVPQTTQVGGG